MEPFFWAADTAWGIFQSLNDSSLDKYLADRKAKNFNVIQCTIIFDKELTYPNLNGDWVCFLPQRAERISFILFSRRSHQITGKHLSFALRYFLF